MSVLGRAHGGLVFQRRVRVLADRLAPLLPDSARVLDVGCGDGAIDAQIGAARADVTISGIEVLVRPETRVPVEPFDGATIPYGDGSFDVVMFVDVLHHSVDAEILLGEARRVARRAVVLKDHTLDGVLAGPTLRFMDWVGNAPHGVVLPYNYWPERRWREAFGRAGLKPVLWEKNLGLYPPPASLLFDRSLHFICRLDIL